MEYEISKSITGIAVKYECPKCKTSLRSALNKAGQNDACPDCQTSFVIPGTKELQKYNAQLLVKQRQKVEAKEQNQLERERQKQNQLEQQQRKFTEAKQREQEQLARQAEREQLRQHLLTGTSFDPSNHDWSTGAPYVYDCIQIGTLAGNWQTTLRDIINRKASEGWEYFRSESLVASRSNGCLAGLFGFVCRDSRTRPKRNRNRRFMELRLEWITNTLRSKPSAIYRSARANPGSCI